MSKIAHIRQLYAGGTQTVCEINALTGYDRHYIANILWNIRTAGAMGAAMSKWRKSHPENPTKLSRRRNRHNAMLKKMTLPTAGLRGQLWTITDLDFLRDHGKQMSIVELALKLRRTAKGIQQAGYRYKIDLRK